MHRSPAIRRFSLVLLAVGLPAVGLLASGCGSNGRDLRAPAANAVSPTRSSTPSSTLLSILGSGVPLDLSVRSPSFAEGASIPAQFSCNGPNPALNWSGIPAGTEELAIVVVDPDSDAGELVYWIVTGISPTASGVAQGSVPLGATVHRNSAGTLGYRGPCPPAGRTHTYRFEVLALPQPSALAIDTDPLTAAGSLETSAGGNLATLNGSFTAGGSSSTGSAGSGPAGTSTTAF